MDQKREDSPVSSNESSGSNNEDSEVKSAIPADTTHPDDTTGAAKDFEEDKVSDKEKSAEPEVHGSKITFDLPTPKSEEADSKESTPVDDSDKVESQSRASGDLDEDVKQRHKTESVEVVEETGCDVEELSPDDSANWKELVKDPRKAIKAKKWQGAKYRDQRINIPESVKSEEANLEKPTSEPEVQTELSVQDLLSTTEEPVRAFNPYAHVSELPEKFMDTYERPDRFQDTSRMDVSKTEPSPIRRKSSKKHVSPRHRYCEPDVSVQTPESDPASCEKFLHTYERSDRFQDTSRMDVSKKEPSPRRRKSSKKHVSPRHRQCEPDVSGQTTESDPASSVPTSSSDSASRDILVDSIVTWPDADPLSASSVQSLPEFGAESDHEPVRYRPVSLPEELMDADAYSKRRDKVYIQRPSEEIKPLEKKKKKSPKRKSPKRSPVKSYKQLLKPVEEQRESASPNTHSEPENEILVISIVGDEHTHTLISGEAEVSPPQEPLFISGVEPEQTEPNREPCQDSDPPEINICSDIDKMDTDKEHSENMSEDVVVEAAQASMSELSLLSNTESEDLETKEKDTDSSSS